MAETSGNRKQLWYQAFSSFKEKLSAEDKAFFRNEFKDPSQLGTSLLAELDRQSSSNRSSGAVVNRTKHFAKILAIFTTSVPEVSNIFWTSLALLHERSRVNNETQTLFREAIHDITSAIPEFNEYEEVFADMADVEAAMIAFYSKVFELFLALLENIKRSASWKHHIGLSPAPIATTRILKEIQDLKRMVEKEVFKANGSLQIKRHKEIHALLAQLAVQGSRKSQLPCRVIPYSSNPHFHGRHDILDKIDAHLVVSRKQRSLFAISGLGGVGKTQIALKYIYDHLDHFPAVFWMQADTQQKLSASYVNAAKRLQLEPEDSQKDADAVATVLKTWLSETKENWLIIYDNADDLNVLKPFWPPGNQGCILITSRDPASSRFTGAGLHVPPLSPTEGETLFVSLLTTPGVGIQYPHNPAMVRTIIKQLGYLPLAIVHVSSFIVERDCTLEEFEEMYTSSLHNPGQGLPVLEISTANLFYEHSLATVWKVSITRLSANCLRLLRVLSCFDPDGVPELLLREGSKGIDALEFLGHGLPYFNALQELMAAGLVTKDNVGAMAGYSTAQARSLVLHRLVKETVFHQLNEEEQRQTLGDALALLLGAWPVNAANPFRMNAFWSKCSLLLPHVLALESRFRDSPYIIPPAGVIRLFFYTSWYLFERRMSELALPLLQTGRDVCARSSDTDPFFSKLLTAYGAVCLECNQVPQSAEWFAQVVTIYRNDPNTPDWLLATSLSDLANPYTDMRRYAESEQLLREALQITNGITDPQTKKDWSVHCGHNLSRLLIEMGNPEEALQLQFLHGDEFAGGLIQENSQRGALFLYGIGNTYHAMAHKKSLEGAEERRAAMQYHTRALRARTEVCGQHYVTGVSLHKVGVLLHEAGDHQGAKGALQQAADIFNDSFNAIREYARSLFHLSVVAEALGESLDASRLLTEAWQHQYKITGLERTPANEKDSSLFDGLVLYVHH